MNWDYNTSPIEDIKNFLTLTRAQSKNWRGALAPGDVFHSHEVTVEVEIRQCPRCSGKAKPVYRTGKDTKYKCVKCKRMFTESMIKSPVAPQITDAQRRHMDAR